jgi:hypothetical protein
VAGIFKANNPTNGILLVLYVIVIRSAGFFNYTLPIRSSSDAFLYRGILQVLDIGAISWMYPFVTLVLITIQAFFLNRISNSLRLFPKPNYLVGVSYILVSSIVPHWYHFSAPLVATTLIIWIYHEVVKLQLHSNIRARLFNLGMAAGLCLFVFPPAILFVLLIFAGLSMFKAFRINQWLIVLIGVAVPVYFYYSWQFLNDGVITNKFPHLFLHFPIDKLNNLKFTILLAFSIYVVLGLLYSQQNLRKQLVQTRNAWKLSYVYLVLSTVLFFVTTATSEFDQIFIAVPISLLAATAHFYLPKAWVSNLIHLLMLIFAIYVGYLQGFF